MIEKLLVYGRGVFLGGILAEQWTEEDKKCPFVRSAAEKEVDVVIAASGVQIGWCIDQEGSIKHCRGTKGGLYG